MEDYAAKMQLKSDAALREYVTGYAQYRDEAVLAALGELRRRGQPAAEEAELRPLLEAAVQQQAAAAAIALPNSISAQVSSEEEQPALYTPGVIILFSVLFNTIITGAVLLAINLRRLKQTKALWGLAAFVLAYLVLEGVVVSMFFAQKAKLSPFLIPLLNLPAILAYILWFWPRYVGTYQFQPRSWLMPLLICFIIVMALGLLLSHLPGFAQLMKAQSSQMP